ncbi:MAG: hypothetical protein KDC98_10485 [Planctomycetes bacterium]|nr:hypothetical protein [Planctomycetota bacterium]
MAEADLYPPIKRFLEQQGYAVKGEIDDCDLVAVRADEPPVIVELKQRLNLALVLQAIDRLAISASVYIAFAEGHGGSAAWSTRRRQVTGLLRRLGLGLLTVSTRGRVTAVLDPGPYRPRSDKPRRRHLLKEFAERVGDPETGGSSSRPRLTAYRQDALRCAHAIATAGTLAVGLVRERTGVERAGPILQANHYGWFERVRIGHYTISPKGRRELADWGGALEDLTEGPAPESAPANRTARSAPIR